MAQAINDGKTDEARILTGRLRAVDSITGALFPPDRVKPLEEEPFVDPAQIRKVRK